MTETWIWGLVAALILLAVSTSIKAATEAVTIKSLDDTIAALRKQIEMINQKFDETTQKQSIVHTREKDESTKTIANLTSQITYLKAHSVPLTPDMDPQLTYEFGEAYDEAIKETDKT